MDAFALLIRSDDDPNSRPDPDRGEPPRIAMREHSVPIRNQLFPKFCHPITKDHVFFKNLLRRTHEPFRVSFARGIESTALSIAAIRLTAVGRAARSLLAASITFSIVAPSSANRARLHHSCNSDKRRSPHSQSFWIHSITAPGPGTQADLLTRKPLLIKSVQFVFFVFEPQRKKGLS